MGQYNGHRSWNAWNVALWMSNDEALYRFAMECIRTTKNLHTAARRFMQQMGGEQTPDGGVYNLTCVHEALSGLKASVPS